MPVNSDEILRALAARVRNGEEAAVAELANALRGASEKERDFFVRQLGETMFMAWTALRAESGLAPIMDALKEAPS